MGITEQAAEAARANRIIVEALADIIRECAERMDQGGSEEEMLADLHAKHDNGAHPAFLRALYEVAQASKEQLQGMVISLALDFGLARALTTEAVCSLLEAMAPKGAGPMPKDMRELIDKGMDERVFKRVTADLPQHEEIRQILMATIPVLILAQGTAPKGEVSDEEIDRLFGSLG